MTPDSLIRPENSRTRIFRYLLLAKQHLGYNFRGYRLGVWALPFGLPHPTLSLLVSRVYRHTAVAALYAALSRQGSD